jgi:regulator of sigma E protease
MGYALMLLILGQIIFLHELGHLAASLVTGVAINSFNIGFGKIIFSKRFYGIDFALRLFPLGGYVVPKLPEECEAGELSIEDAPYLKQVCIYLGGVTVNFISGFVCFLALYLLSGNDFTSSVLSSTKLVTYIFNSTATNITDINEFSSVIGIINNGGDLMDKQIILGANQSFLSFLLMSGFLHYGIGIANLLPIAFLDGGQCISSALKKLSSERSIFRSTLKYYDYLSLSILVCLFVYTTSKDAFAVITNIIKTFSLI